MRKTPNAVNQGIIKPLFCVHEDELLWASDELLRETGQTHHVVRSHINEVDEQNVAKLRVAQARFSNIEADSSS